jgi:hypothetical protein
LTQKRPSTRITPWAFAVWAIAGGSGCQLFMNLDVDGYDAAPEPSDAACPGDASACAFLGCISSANCDGGQICCLSIASSGPPLVAAAVCQTGPCAATSFQGCQSSTECGSSISCIPCTVGGISLSACDSPLASLACHSP